MISTEISLSKEEYAAAKQEAARRGISLDELLRRSLRRLLAETDSKPWMAYAGFVESSDPAACRRVDEVVYGHDDRSRVDPSA